MPRLTAPIGDNEEVMVVPGAGNFQFSAVRPDELEETEYTLVTVVVDISSSVMGFATELLDCVKSIVKACKKNDRSNNLLLRFLVFNEDIMEIHGFKNLSDIDIDAYNPLNPSGMTALFDATYDGVVATLTYAKQLDDLNYDCNAVVYVITDGMNNRGSMTPGSIKSKIEMSLKKEEIMEIITILVGLHDPNDPWGPEVEQHLKDFRADANLTEFLDIGEATPQKLAKLANWVSQSISSTSQALANGQKSQPLAF